MGRHGLWRRLGWVGCWLCSPAVFAQDYRELEFQDGRIWQVDLKGSDAEGMLVEIPQGEAHVSYDDVSGIRPITLEQYEQAEAWQIRLVTVEAGGQEGLEGDAKTFRDELARAVEDRPGLKLAGARVRVKTGVPGTVPDDCGIRSSVSLSTEGSKGVDYLVSSFLSQSDSGSISAVVCSQYTRGLQPVARWEGEISGISEPAGRALSAVLGLIHPVVGPIDFPPPIRHSAQVEVPEIVDSEPPVPNDGATAVTGGTPKQEPAEQLTPAEAAVEGPDLRRLAFVPLPGFPSLYVRDMPGFGRAWLAAVPLATVAGLWINRSVAFRPGQSLFLTTAAYYVITVGTNQYTARQSGVLVDDRFPAEP